MKIAISTDDKLHVSNQFCQSKFYKIFLIEKGTIVKEEFRDNYCPGKGSHSEVYNIIGDCNTIIATDFDAELNTFFKGRGCKVIRTNENIITKAVVNYVNEMNRIQSNYCCQP